MIYTLGRATGQSLWRQAGQVNILKILRTLTMLLIDGNSVVLYGYHLFSQVVHDVTIDSGASLNGSRNKDTSSNHSRTNSFSLCPTLIHRPSITQDESISLNSVSRSSESSIISNSTITYATVPRSTTLRSGVSDWCKFKQWFGSNVSEHGVLPCLVVGKWKPSVYSFWIAAHGTAGLICCKTWTHRQYEPSCAE